MFLLLVAALATLDAPKPAIPVEVRAPIYPDVAVRAVMTGTVEVEDTIDPAGMVTGAKVTGEAAYSDNIIAPPLSSAAVDAAREWRFNSDAAASPRKYVIRFEFSVDRDAAWKWECYVGPPSVTILLPTQTVRIRGRLRPGPATVLH